MTDGMTYEKAIEVLKRNKPTSDPRRCGQELCLACDVAIEALEKVESLQERIEDLEVLVGMQRKRKYYNKFVKEVWQKEHGKLSYPDFDEIYKRYFEQQERFDRIIEQFEKQSHTWKPSSKEWWKPSNTTISLKKAIEIVKAGGKDE